jgi:hypothetical protein
MNGKIGTHSRCMCSEASASVYHVLVDESHASLWILWLRSSL